MRRFKGYTLGAQGRIPSQPPLLGAPHWITTAPAGLRLSTPRHSRAPP